MGKVILEPRVIVSVDKVGLNLMPYKLNLCYTGNDFRWKWKNLMRDFFTAHFFKVMIGSHALRWIVIIDPIYSGHSMEQIEEEAKSIFLKSA